MTDVLRYRIVRAPRELSPRPDRTLYYPRQSDAGGNRSGQPKWKAPDESKLISGAAKAQTARAAVSKAVTAVKSAQAFLGSASAVPQTPSNSDDPFLLMLIAFARALDDAQGRLSSEKVDALLKVWAEGHTERQNQKARTNALCLVLDKRWKTLRVRVGDSLIAAVLQKAPALYVRFLTRLMLAIGLIEDIASMAPGEALDEEKVAALYLLRVVVLPPSLLPAEAADTKLNAMKGVGAVFARAPAFTDHVVVREEWSCYVPGEIAHIENVLDGERKERRHVRLEESETTDTQDITTISLEERDQQTTDRNSLQEEASTQTKLDVGVEAQVDVGAQYGPTHIETHFGASLNYSSEESRRKANQQSREVVTRAVERIESKVRQARSTRSLRRVKEINSHLIDNSTSPAGHVVGVYRWVDKVNRLQTRLYRHRFVLEFQVPEPAAFARWLRSVAPKPKVNVDPPPAFTNLANQPLTPAHIDVGTYQELVARFKASGVLPPPDASITVTAAKHFTAESTPPGDRDDRVGVVPTINGAIELAVPKDYEAVSATVSVAAAPALFRWRDQEEQPGNKYMAEKLGYHVVTAAVTFAGAVVKLSTVPTTTVRATSGNVGVAYNSAWTTSTANFPPFPAGGVGYGTMTAGVTIGGTYRCSVSLRVQCQAQPQLLDQWRLDTFDRLRAAHAAAESAYKEALNAAEVRAGIVIDERPPERNAQTVREELKRQVIEMLLGANFDGFECLQQPVDPVKGPQTQLATASAVAPLVQFLEQAFEWDNMTYVLYPYFWTDRARWRDLQPMDGADPAYVRFLRSGSARVVLPARPGFEWSVLYFSIYGEPWLGGPPPLPGDPLYVSVAQEIQDQLGAPDDGVAGDMWEVKLPTTLVWIDPDPSLPKCNTTRTLQGTPVIDLCGASCAPTPAPAPSPSPSPAPAPAPGP